MRRFLTVLAIMLTGIMAAHAQGSVTVSQSAEIDALVNGKKTAKKPAKETRQKVENQRQPSRQTTSTAAAPKKQDTKGLYVPKLNEHRPEISKPENVQLRPIHPVRTKLVKRLVRRPHVPTEDELEGTHLVTKRIKKSAKKVRGFRVQVYSGGNTRTAHQQADKAGQKAKQLFPTQPVYVHFYSPRWMCLVGNFTSYNEARKVMRTLRKEGYPHANVIRTMVTVKTTEFVEE
ncbi:MAG: SPOR domain-containing protein [Prevotella sp.]|nr:SPOR domain-containing protein [Prevotella sp.]